MKTLKKLISLLTKNFGLKLLAIGVAAIMWLFVVNIDDPEISKNYTCSVSIDNSSYMTEIGKFYQVIDSSNVITFTVEAKRSVIEKMASTDFKVTADMENIIIDEKAGIGTVPIDISALRYSSQVSIPVTSEKLKVSIENLESSQFIISAQTSGELGEGLVVGDITAVPNLIKVSGPASVIDQIDSVYATIDISNMTSDVSGACIPVFVDKYGETVDSSNLSTNTDTATVKVEILDTKDVGLVFRYTGEPADGYVLKDIDYEPTTIKVKGKADALNSITSISVPASALDISGAMGDVEQTIDVSSYLPDGISLVGEGKVNVTAIIDSVSSKELTCFVSKIDVVNLPEDYELTFADSYVQFTLTGQTDIVNSTTSADVQFMLDASDLELGSNKVKLIAELPSELECDDVYVNVRVARKLADAATTTVTDVDDDDAVETDAPDIDGSSTDTSETDTTGDGDTTSDSDENDTGETATDTY